MSVMKNKAPADLQITAEQILLEAYESKDPSLKLTEHKINDLEELQQMQLKKRTEYENALRMNRLNIGQWLRYATFEIEQRDYRRARSVFERCLEVDPTNVTVWIRYSQTELKGKNINHARNVLERATTVLPRVDKLWYLYVNLEETLGNVVGTRDIFLRWINWRPSENVWKHFIYFESRYGELENCRKIFEKFVVAYPKTETWLYWVSFEKQHGDAVDIRNVYTLAIDSVMSLGKDFLNETLFVSWCEWETQQKEFARVRALYKYGMDHLTGEKRNRLFEQYTIFEKQYGNREGIEETIMQKRKMKYEQLLSENPYDYDNWWLYIELLEGYNDTTELLEQTYNKILDTVPQSHSKPDWEKYIYLWLKYLFVTELESKDTSKAREGYKKLISLIPHKKLTFAKAWTNYAYFEVRQDDLPQARKILGQSLGLCPKRKLFKSYIAMELKLKEFDRVRKLYEKFIETWPMDVSLWMEYAEFENQMDDDERCKAIYEIVTNGSEILPDEERKEAFSKFIEYLMSTYQYSEARNAYSQFLILFKHDTVIWTKKAIFELTIPSEEQLNEYLLRANQNEDLEFEFEATEESKQRTRKEFEKALAFAKATNNKSMRVMLFQAFKEFESVYGTKGSQEEINERFPTVVRRREGDEEVVDYVFPDDQLDSKQVEDVEDSKPKSAMQKFLENAKKWKEKQS
ncbi:hypothetical protein LJB42_002963 [Komagataella kurtzmanii]|nr:hypothetical protein LJB42_002963 [Komagataella kurtzmanii]